MCPQGFCRIRATACSMIMPFVIDRGLQLSRQAAFPVDVMDALGI
jgi:hypothetical protein